VKKKNFVSNEPLQLFQLCKFDTNLLQIETIIYVRTDSLAMNEFQVVCVVIKALLADWLKLIETTSKSPKYLNSFRLRVGTFHVKTIKEKTDGSDRGKRKKKNSADDGGGGRCPCVSDE
jgi:hypothetical protein